MRRDYRRVATERYLEAYRHGIQLLNQERYFEAHEVLEDLWRAAPTHENAAKS